MPDRGLIDTSVVIELERVDPAGLPAELAVSSITLAELAAGPHATSDPEERARRQDRLQRVQALFDPLPFDGEAARAYGRIYAAVRSAGRKARGRRFADLLIAATALAAGLPVYTRNPDDFASLRRIVEVVPVEGCEKGPVSRSELPADLSAPMQLSGAIRIRRSRRSP